MIPPEYREQLTAGSLPDNRVGQAAGQRCSMEQSLSVHFMTSDAEYDVE